MIKLTFCQDCERELRSFGNFAFEAFEYICFMYFYDAPIEILDHEFENIFDAVSLWKFLENKSYVITTESGLDTIQIKPLHVSSSRGLNGRYVRFCKHDC